MTLKHCPEHPSRAEEVWGVSVQTLLPPSKVLPEAASLQSVTEALECQVVLSDVEVFDEEDFLPLGVSGRS